MHSHFPSAELSKRGFFIPPRLIPATQRDRRTRHETEMAQWGSDGTRYSVPPGGKRLQGMWGKRKSGGERRKHDLRHVLEKLQEKVGGENPN